MQGVTNDAAQARRAKLQAELQEKQEDLQDTLYQHSIDLQQEGYNKLSEDMQAALDRAIELINGKIEVLNQTAASMLKQLKNNGFDEAGTIKDIIADNATAVHTSTDAIINALSGENGLIGQLGIKIDNLDISKTINSSISSIINSLAGENGVINTSANSIIQALSGEGGISSLLENIGFNITKEDVDSSISSIINSLAGEDGIVNTSANSVIDALTGESGVSSLLNNIGVNLTKEDINSSINSVINALAGEDGIINASASSIIDALSGEGGIGSILEGIGVNMTGEEIASSIAPVINGLAGEDGIINASASSIISALTGDGGIGSLLKDLGVKIDGIDIAKAIEDREPDAAVAKIDSTPTAAEKENSLGTDVSDQLRDIETAIGSLKPSEEDKAKIEKERQEKLAELNRQIESLNNQIELEESNIKANNNIISEKQAQKDAAQANIDNLYNAIDNLFTQRDADYTLANANNAAADNWMVKANKAKKKSKKKEYTDNANVLRQNASQLIARAQQEDAQANALIAQKSEVENYNYNIINGLTSEINSLNSTISGYQSNLDGLKKQLQALKDKKLELELPKSITTPETARGEDSVSGIESNNTKTPKTVYDTNDAAAQTQATQAAAQAAQAAAQAAQAAAQAIEKIRVDENGDPILHYAKGTKRIHKDQLAWTNEYADKVGSEMIIRPSDGAILTPLKANDSVIPANLADNLFKWGAISPDKFITNPFVGKWSAEGGSSVTNNADYTAAPQTVEMHFDSLFHIEGNVDESVMPRLENLGKTLVNDRDFQKNVIKFVTKDFVRESKKQGIR